ncbi:two-partner secretion domain-containing protein, partial [Herbaspirillum rubrisubalbicans]
MNKIYRLVFSKHHGMLVAVAENAVSQRKGGGGMVIGGRIDPRVPLTVRRLTMAVMAAFSMITVLPSWAAAPLPTGGVVSSGTGSINVNGQTMSIQQGSQVLGLNWTGFSIGAGNTVNFAQPSVSAVAVNRVIGTEASQIYGNLNANGQIYLINPNGIVFGSTAQVNVGSLLASTATNVSIDGNSVVLSGQSGATVVNQGNIKATDGGFVVLSGQQVSNSGRIQANGGYVALMAGDKVSLQLDNGALVSVNVDASAVQALVDNKGLILADGGRVYLTAWGKNTLLSTVVNNDGIIRARGYGSSAGGTVVLLGEGGDTVTRGSIDVSGQGAGQQGGTVVLGGDRVGVFDNAKIDASGVAGGGRVVIGGDSLNKARSVANIGFANSTYVGSNTTINIGSSQGDGGFVETSGENLAMLGRVNATSAGKAGQWLIDPTNITINTGSSNATNSSNTWSGSGTDSVVNNASIEAALNSGANVTVTTNSSGSGTGWINVSANIAKTSGGNASLTLYANDSINISG